MKPLQSSPLNKSSPSYVETLLHQKKFTFQPRRGQLDLRSITNLDVDRIAREVDIDSLQTCLENITFSSISQDDLNLYSNDCFIRLFQIAQLTLEYLLNVQDILASNLNALAKKYSMKKRELERMKQIELLKENEVMQLKQIIRMNETNLTSVEDIRNVSKNQQSHTNSMPEYHNEQFEKQSNKSVDFTSNLQEQRCSQSQGFNSLPTNPSHVSTQFSSSHMNKIMEPSSQTLHLYIIRWNIGKCIDISVPFNYTVKQLKEEIARITKSTTPLIKQEISLKGIILSDNLCLYNTRIKDESVLILMEPTEENLPLPNEPSHDNKKKEKEKEKDAIVHKTTENEIQKKAMDLAAVALNSQKELTETNQLLRAELYREKERESTLKSEIDKRLQTLEQSLKDDLKKEIAAVFSSNIHLTNANETLPKSVNIEHGEKNNQIITDEQKTDNSKKESSSMSYNQNVSPYMGKQLELHLKSDEQTNKLKEDNATKKNVPIQSIIKCNTMESNETNDSSESKKICSPNRYTILDNISPSSLSRKSFRSPLRGSKKTKKATGVTILSTANSKSFPSTPLKMKTPMINDRLERNSSSVVDKVSTNEEGSIPMNDVINVPLEIHQKTPTSSGKASITNNKMESNRNRKEKSPLPFDNDLTKTQLDERKVKNDDPEIGNQNENQDVKTNKSMKKDRNSLIHHNDSKFDRNQPSPPLKEVIGKTWAMAFQSPMKGNTNNDINLSSQSLTDGMDLSILQERYKQNPQKQTNINSKQMSHQHATTCHYDDQISALTQSIDLRDEDMSLIGKNKIAHSNAVVKRNVMGNDSLTSSMDKSSLIIETKKTQISVKENKKPCTFAEATANIIEQVIMENKRHKEISNVDDCKNNSISTTINPFETDMESIMDESVKSMLILSTSEEMEIISETNSENKNLTDQESLSSNNNRKKQRIENFDILTETNDDSESVNDQRSVLSNNSKKEESKESTDDKDISDSQWTLSSENINNEMNQDILVRQLNQEVLTDTFSSFVEDNEEREDDEVNSDEKKYHDELNDNHGRIKPAVDTDNLNHDHDAETISLRSEESESDDASETVSTNEKHESNNMKTKKKRNSLKRWVKTVIGLKRKKKDPIV